LGAASTLRLLLMTIVSEFVSTFTYWLWLLYLSFIVCIPLVFLSKHSFLKFSKAIIFSSSRETLYSDRVGPSTLESPKFCSKSDKSFLNFFSICF